MDEQDEEVEDENAEQEMENIDEFMKQEFDGQNDNMYMDVGNENMQNIQMYPQDQMNFSGKLIYPEEIQVYELALQDLIMA